MGLQFQLLLLCPYRAVHAVLGALVVLPTRELAVQVFDVFASLCPSLGIWTGIAAARLPLPAEMTALKECPPNILIATPGRLMAHLKASSPTLSLKALQFLVSLYGFPAIIFQAAFDAAK